MKILVADGLFPKGHKAYNKNLLISLCQIGQVDVITKKGFLEESLLKEIGVNNIFYAPDIDTEAYKGIVKKHLAYFKTILPQLKYINDLSYDAVIIASYDIMQYFICSFLIKKPHRVYIVEHNTIDKLAKRKWRFFYSFYKHKVNHIVIEQFIKQHLVKELHVEQQLVHVVHQATESCQLNEPDKISLKNLKIFAPSESNDPHMLDKFVKDTHLTKYLEEQQIELVIKKKSSGRLPASSAIKVITGYIPDDEYKKLFEESTHILLTFPEHYNYRASGTLRDALSQNKIFVGSDCHLVKYYKEKFPNICYSVNNPADLIDLLNKHYDKNSLEREFKEYSEAYSLKEVTRQLKKVLMK